MVTGVLGCHGFNVTKHAEVDINSVSGCVTIHRQVMVENSAQDQNVRARPAILNPVQLMVNGELGLPTLHVVGHVGVEL
jgi:hypothetical protein